jgi:hypothetical protein
VLGHGIPAVEATMCVQFHSSSSTGILEDGLGLRLAKGIISFDLEQPFPLASLACSGGEIGGTGR